MTTAMTPEQKIKHAIILKVISWGDFRMPDGGIDYVNVDDVYGEIIGLDALQDCKNEFRHGEVVTDIRPDHDRNFESKSVAAKMPDGSWVGWTYWHGGGKHSAPETIEWMSEAYNLDCEEEEKVIIHRTFTKTLEFNSYD